ncbi:teneurin-3 isoform X1 [Micractinium conductrix]|uniref:Teneurin-3 isoform X1 n=1 Tax=Micractinium conductrix TaxID=554055 RepID=A0A2P6V4G4_9CHLO|nr:teneurin-3 isoform X1 [Micractinium conductrix]|eukprot:PSC68976.1 teneurin-3 isoform X1 [Micractinium conductrix]
MATRGLFLVVIWLLVSCSGWVQKRPRPPSPMLRQDDGYACEDASQCCSGRCNKQHGTCGCIADRESCLVDSDCCGGLCGAWGLCGCAPGGFCLRQVDCCEGLYCDYDNRCERPGRGCRPLGEPCATAADCCNSLACEGGSCTVPCMPAGELCYDAADCCDGRSCGLRTDGEQYVCA